MPEPSVFGRASAASRRFSLALHRFAVFTACSTLLLIVAGGLVTSTESGLSVPDWPTTYGSNMEPEDARLAGQGLPRGSRLWAKSGDAYDFHHLVGRVVLPNGSDFVIAVFTKGVKTVPGIIPRIYEKVAAHFMAGSPSPLAPNGPSPSPDSSRTVAISGASSEVGIL